MTSDLIKPAKPTLRSSEESAESTTLTFVLKAPFVYSDWSQTIAATFTEKYKHISLQAGVCGGGTLLRQTDGDHAAGSGLFIKSVDCFFWSILFWSCQPRTMKKRTHQGGVAPLNMNTAWNQSTVKRRTDRNVCRQSQTPTDTLTSTGSNWRIRHVSHRGRQRGYWFPVRSQWENSS